MQQSVLNGIILGHNAFFGVDHLSAARGNERAAYFQDPNRVLDVIREAHRQGAAGMMMSTHERAKPISELIAGDKQLATDFRVYPLLPYVQKYVTRSNEVGMINVVLEMLSGTTLSEKFSLFRKGGMAFLSRDINSILAAVMQIELKPFSNCNVPAVFLHDAFTDLALAFEIREVFEFYVEEIRKSFNSRGAFATKNLPLLLKRFKEWGLPKPIVMTHFNKVGYHMNPDRGSCETAAAENEVSILAMGSLASGFLSPEEAYQYLGQIRNIDGVVVGVSRTDHIGQTFDAIARNMPNVKLQRSPAHS